VSEDRVAIVNRERWAQDLEDIRALLRANRHSGLGGSDGLRNYGQVSAL